MRSFFALRFLFASLLFVGATTQLIAPSAQAAIKVPALTGPVMDFAGYLDASDARGLENVLYDYNRQGKAQIQVLVLPDLQGEEIESASIQITNQWKLGDQKRDNGILFLIAAKEHKLRIEVGQGLEGTLPDLTAKRIITDTVTPYFKNGQMSEGIAAGVLAIIRSVDKEYADTNLGPAAPAPEHSKRKKNSLPILLILFFVLIILSRLFRGGGRGGGGGFLAGALLGSMAGGGRGGFGGRGGGGGWSGGGGGFSGGGASGSW